MWEETSEEKHLGDLWEGLREICGNDGIWRLCGLQGCLSGLFLTLQPFAKALFCVPFTLCVCGTLANCLITLQCLGDPTLQV